MTNNTKSNLLLKLDLTNNLFLFFSLGFSKSQKIFDSLDTENQVLVTKKLQELNRIIEISDKSSKLYQFDTSLGGSEIRSL